MATFRPDPLTAEAMRLASVADDMAERLAALERKAEAAADLGYPGPSTADLVHARKLARTARLQADAARRTARGEKRRKGRAA